MSNLMPQCMVHNIKILEARTLRRNQDKECKLRIIIYVHTHIFYAECQTVAMTADTFSEM